MTVALLAVSLGVLLANVLPAAAKPGVKFAPLTEDDFQRILAKRGLR